MKTIIFLNGFAVPVWLSKTNFVWNDNLWKDYNRVYYTSKVPTSDFMVEDEIFNLEKLISKYDNPIIVGQSLGAWWAANLACHTKQLLNKVVLWTPLNNHTIYPIFMASDKYIPYSNNTINKGNNKILLCYGSHDLIVPQKDHTPNLIETFDPYIYKLYGGHLFQINHKNGLLFMKKWIESK